MRRGPQHVSNVLSQLMARRGFAREQAAAACQEAWGRAAGPLAVEHTRAGSVRRGALEVIVASSTLLQELSFQKSQLLKTLSELLPDEGIRDIRFRVGSIK